MSVNILSSPTSPITVDDLIQWKMEITDLKVWIDDYITQMEFEQEDEASLEEQECKGYLEDPYDYYNLGVGHGGVEATLETLKLVRSRL